jgi:hypothetical protein
MRRYSQNIESLQLPLDLANTNVINVDDFESWIETFNQVREETYIHSSQVGESPVNSTYARSSFLVPPASDKSGFGLSILESSEDDLSPTSTATSPTFSEEDKGKAMPGLKTLDEASSPTIPHWNPGNTEDVGHETTNPDQGDLVPPLGALRKEASPNVQNVPAATSRQGASSGRAVSLPHTPVAETLPLRTTSIKQTLFDVHAKLYGDSQTLRQVKSTPNVHPLLGQPGIRRSHHGFNVLPYPQSPVPPSISPYCGDRDECITALPPLRPPTGPLPSTPNKKKLSAPKPCPSPLSGFPVPPSSNAVSSPTQAAGYVSTQANSHARSTRSSICSANTTSTGKGTSVTKLKARVEALERENRLLDAALMAVLKTSGSLNGCPCGIRQDREDKEDKAIQEWRASLDTGESGTNALDVYLRTRMARLGSFPTHGP